MNRQVMLFWVGYSFVMIGSILAVNILAWQLFATGMFLIMGSIIARMIDDILGDE